MVQVPTKPRFVEVMKSQFNYWKNPKTQIEVLRTYLREIKPTVAIARGQPITFDVPGAVHLYNDLTSSNLRIRARIVQPDGTPITAAMHVGTANLYAHSMFGDILVELGGKLMNLATNGLYPYRSYIETLINTREENKLTWGPVEGFYRDTAAHIDEPDPNSVDNAGLHAREARFAAGRECEMTLRPFVDVFQQELCIPSNLNLRILLYPAQNEFLLKAAVLAAVGGAVPPNVLYRMEITEATLVLETNEVDPSMEASQKLILYKGMNMRFYYRNMEIKQFVITPNQGMHFFNKAFSPPLPDRILLALVTQTAKNGHWQQNPFNFAHHNVNHVKVTIDNTPHESRPLEPDYRAPNFYMEAYNSLWRAANKMYKNASVGISFEEFPQGYAIYGVDLSADGSGGECPNAPRTGELRIEIGFRVNPPAALTLIAIGDKPGWFEVDSAGEVILP